MTVYYPLKSICENQTGCLIKYECTPYDAVGSWKSFTSFKDKIKFFSKCFLSEKKCAHYCIKQMCKENNGKWF